MNLEVSNTNINAFPYKSTIPLDKRVFICLPNDLSPEYDKETCALDILKKLEKYYPNKSISVTWNNSTDEDNLYCLGMRLEEISYCDLVVFGIGWSSSRFCTMIHKILEEYNFIFMYEWELDLQESLASMLKKEGGKAND